MNQFNCRAIPYEIAMARPVLMASLVRVVNLIKLRNPHLTIALSEP
jgi:hypothetical protein